MPAVPAGLPNPIIALITLPWGTMWDLQCWQLSQGSSVFDQSPAQLEIGGAALVVILVGNFLFVTVTTVSQLWSRWNMELVLSLAAMNPSSSLQQARSALLARHWDAAHQLV